MTKITKTIPTQEYISTFLIEEISDILSIDKEEIDCSTSIKEFGLDSLEVVELIMDVEDKFEIEIYEEQITDSTTINDFKDIIVAKLNNT